MAKMASTKARKVGNGTNRGKDKNSGANIRFAEIDNGRPRNAVISTDQTEAIRGGNELNFGEREVLPSKTIRANRTGE